VSISGIPSSAGCPIRCQLDRAANRSAGLVEGHYGGQGGLDSHGGVLDVAALWDISLGVVLRVAVGPGADVDDRGPVAGLDERAVVVAWS
jgi:hypothetical protein